MAVLAVILKYICQATILTMMMWQARYFSYPMAVEVAPKLTTGLMVRQVEAGVEREA